jgi:hypothetical protein
MEANVRLGGDSGPGNFGEMETRIALNTRGGVKTPFVKVRLARADPPNSEAEAEKGQPTLCSYRLDVALANKTRYRAGALSFA